MAIYCSEPSVLWQKLTCIISLNGNTTRIHRLPLVGLSEEWGVDDAFGLLLLFLLLTHTSPRPSN